VSGDLGQQELTLSDQEVTPRGDLGDMVGCPVPQNHLSPNRPISPAKARPALPAPRTVTDGEWAVLIILQT